MSDSGKAVFLSYASQDAEAARRIAESLRAAGIEVWFDQSELVGGDAWDQKIRTHIKECALLIPVMSKSTQARREGYFRLEWKLADERTYLMAKGTPFLLPVTIDETTDRNALVPDSFMAVQWTKAPAGELPAGFAERIKKFTDGSAADPRASEPRPREIRVTARPRRRWLRPVLASAVVMIVVLVSFVLRKTPGHPSAGAATRQTSKVQAEPTDSEARKLVQKADTILAKNGITTEQLGIAAELCERALTLDPTDAKVWGTASIVDSTYLFTGFDRTEARRQQALNKAARAVALAPDSVEARWANAFAMGYAGSPELRSEAIAMTATLVKERPDDRSLLISYGTLLRESRRYDEAAAIFERTGDDQSAGWNYFSAGRLVDARRAADRLLARGATSGSLLLKTFVEGIGFEDPVACQEVVDRFTATDLLDVSPFRSAAITAYYRHQPERLLRLVDAYPQDFLFAAGTAEPKRYLAGLGQEQAGRPDAAQAEWSLALQQVEKRLASHPNEPDGIAMQALLLACLNKRSEAEKSFALYRGLVADPSADSRMIWILLRLGRNEEALTELAGRLRSKKGGWRFAHFEARFDPRWDALRNDPRLQALLEETRWPEAKPF